MRALRGTVSRTLLIAVLAVVLLFLQWSLWGDRGMLRWFSLQSDSRAMRQTNEELRAKNEELKREIDDLKTGVGALEEQAREDLGMVKSGETFFKIIERRGQEDAEAQTR